MKTLFTALLLLIMSICCGFSQDLRGRYQAKKSTYSIEFLDSVRYTRHYFNHRLNSDLTESGKYRIEDGVLLLEHQGLDKEKPQFLFDKVIKTEKKNNFQTINILAIKEDSSIYTDYLIQGTELSLSPDSLGSVIREGNPISDTLRIFDASGKVEFTDLDISPTNDYTWVLTFEKKPTVVEKYDIISILKGKVVLKKTNGTKVVWERK